MTDMKNSHENYRFLTCTAFQKNQARSLTRVSPPRVVWGWEGVRGRAHLSVIEWDLDAQGPRIEPNRRGLRPWLLHLLATMTWSKLLEPQSAHP